MAHPNPANLDPSMHAQLSRLGTRLITMADRLIEAQEASHAEALTDPAVSFAFDERADALRSTIAAGRVIGQLQAVLTPQAQLLTPADAFDLNDVDPWVVAPINDEVGESFVSDDPLLNGEPPRLRSILGQAGTALEQGLHNQKAGRYLRRAVTFVADIERFETVAQTSLDNHRHSLWIATKDRFNNPEADSPAGEELHSQLMLDTYDLVTEALHVTTTSLAQARATLGEEAAAAVLGDYSGRVSAHNERVLGNRILDTLSVFAHQPAGMLADRINETVGNVVGDAFTPTAGGNYVQQL